MSTDTAFVRLAGVLAGHYRVERELGAGGMATVYLAHDLKHDRDVAIKVLKPEFARSVVSERFLREIGITARLSHPHVMPLIDSGATDDGEVLYYVMPLVSGESLRDRLLRDGTLSTTEALRLVTEITEALVYAHANGVVHRDVKPDNVMLSGGHAIVVDFGIAKALGDARGAERLTSEGTSLGTPLYMAPEQSAGEPVDALGDVYAVGVILFEMLAGTPPFTGGLQQVLVDKVTKDAPSLGARIPSAPPQLVALVAGCLSRDARDRPDAGQLLAELRALTLAGAGAKPTRNRISIFGIGVALIVMAAATTLYVRDRRANWVRSTGIPTIQRQFDTDQLDSAFALAVDIEKRSPNDSALGLLWPRIAQKQVFLSEPAGASVSRASIDDTTHWIPVGTTPTASVRIPRNAWYYRYTKPGYRPVTVMGARLGGSYVPIPSTILLRPLNDPDTDMVLLRGADIRGTMYGLPRTRPFALSDFLMDAREVTNKQYKAFVDAGGYTSRTWWDSSIVRDRKPISWSDAMALFVDGTGRPGPATWEGGAPPPESDDIPVGGVSWYEARAYARYARKELPTVYEWNAASIPEAARWVVPHGRFESTSPVRGGDPHSVSPRGVYDMAGNVREWTVNAREPGSRYILGGGWSDPQYVFGDLYTQPELNRSPINGIRLVRRIRAAPDLARASAPIPRIVRDFATMHPVDDATFRGLVTLYDYDHTPLNPTVILRDSSNADWVREDVEFDVPGESTRMRVALFLPRRARPPYQPVVLWPASDAQFLTDVRKLSMSSAEYLVRGGRAVIYPIYEHTYGRGGTLEDTPDGTIAHRDQMLRWAREMRRSMDYATTRPDIDTTRFAFAGTSWGGRIAGVMLAIEPRFRAAVLSVPGVAESPFRPEEDAVNFLPRIHIPVLMLSGKYDSVFPYELSQLPFLRLLGTAPALKRHVIFEGGHFLPRPLMMQETLNWLDKYLGPVTPR